jgi:phenylalanyl-tRNA synthetase beta chain
VLTYPFVSASFGDTLGLPADDPRRQAVRLANPLSDEAPFMRTSVLDTLVDAVRRNVSRGQRDLVLFEIGIGHPPHCQDHRPHGSRAWGPATGPTPEVIAVH